MLQSFTFSPFQENTYVLADDATREAVIIDPGCYDQAEKETLKQFMEQHGLKPTKILLTHAHLDHVFGIAFLKRAYPNLKAYLHPLDQVIFDDVPTRCQIYGLRGYEHAAIDEAIKEGDSLQVGSIKLDVVFVPGHAPGHVAFINHADRFVMGGDVLFRNSIGRTDLPFGNHEQLLQSIRNQLYTLPDDYTVYAGHMEPTTIGHEKKHNPFVRA